MTTPNVLSLFYRAGQQIYTNGAFLSPVKIKIDGQEQWFWKVDQFEDDCFVLGETCFPVENAKTKAELMPNVTE